MRLWDLSRDLLCLASTDGRFIDVNPRFTEVLGWSEEELESTPFLEFVHPDDLEATLAVTGRLGRGEATLEFRNRYRHRDGSWRWLAWTAEPSGDMVFAVARDVTAEVEAEAARRERMQAEARATAMEDLARQHRLLLNAASHELNTPLTPLVLAAARLEALDGVQVRDAARVIRRNVDRLRATIAALLHVSCLATDQLRIRRRPVELRPLLERILAEEGTAAEVHCPDGLRGDCDEALVEQAVSALVRNALLHAGGLRGVEVEPEADAIRIVVHDDGPGFADDEGESWFTPLHRGRESVGRPGAGLGLTTVRLVATAHGGRAGLHSAGPGRGTTAWMEVPVHQH